MGLFEKKTALQTEWENLMKQEQRFLLKRMEKKDTLLNRKLAGKVPPKLQSTLYMGFAKAFELIFEKGTGIIEKTFKKEKMEQDYQVRQYTADVRQDKKALGSFSKKAQGTGAKNLILSGVSGIGMGILGIGLPDIPVFTGMILKDIYEIAIHYGYGYETKEEKYFILLLIQGAVSYGEKLERIDSEINEFIEQEKIPENYEERVQIQRAAGMLSKELLYIKFLQGIPIAGVVGGAYDAVYMQRITEYAGLKYRRRYLVEKKNIFRNKQV
ncbi:MAG: EcsC family protein [Faecalicatena sp.]|uniref:EcsC family protein n=1 Tax=Faecalicatena sp. TaxID=2005360 RepID=UPI00258C87F0|nr:EcsC family protein [Faecalicatena sp.]MCI6464297.1 EcsC family protein [Faecalicatena sp.]MDY4668464.1 EcsC family protein [Oliverpabstia sp.]MDY5621271.1 EcsC family protein [Lachnospiraceae bacterium]